MWARTQNRLRTQNVNAQILAQAPTTGSQTILGFEHTTFQSVDYCYVITFQILSLVTGLWKPDWLTARELMWEPGSWVGCWYIRFILAGKFPSDLHSVGGDAISPCHLKWMSNAVNCYINNKWQMCRIQRMDRHYIYIVGTPYFRLNSNAYIYFIKEFNVES